MKATRRTRTRLLAALTSLASVAVLAVGPSASADPGDPGPSQDQINQAQQNAQQRKGDVDRMQQQLDAADAGLHQLGARAELAVEAYDGAMFRLQQAKAAADKARAVLAAAKAHEKLEQSALGAFAAESYRMDGDIGGLTVLFTAHTLDQLAERAEFLKQIAAIRKYALEDAKTARAQADTAGKAADAAVAQQEAAAEKVKAAKDTAQIAVAGQQKQVDQITAQRNTLLAELAAAQQVTVQLEAQRQEALAEAAARRAAEAAAQDGGPDDSLPLPTGGLGAVIDFAMAQLGKPYVWGGAGPDVYDCSGLVMRAYERAGIDLPHYAASQYADSRPISLGQLRPGDLVFWAYDHSDPSSIHHVALYLGNERILQAPQTGDVVRITDLYEPGTPDFYGRP